ncbi:MAG: SDR family oxidoreductase [Pseudomonadota bacterium]
MSIEFALAGKRVVIVGEPCPRVFNLVEHFVGAGVETVLCSQTQSADLSKAIGAGSHLERLTSYSPEDAATLLERICASYGELDIVVCLCGNSPPAMVEPPADNEADIRKGLIDYLHLNQVANRIMQPQAGGGRIINIYRRSNAQDKGAAAAAAAGLISLSSSLAVEWAPKVRVNAVSDASADLGKTCLFLASHLADYISGATFDN